MPLRKRQEVQKVLRAEEQLVATTTITGWRYPDPKAEVASLRSRGPKPPHSSFLKCGNSFFFSNRVLILGVVRMPFLLLMQTQFNSLAKIGNYRGPLLQSHGTADRLIPYAMGRQLFAAANEPKRFIAIPGGDHNDLQTDADYAVLVEFLGKL
jgi:pimeloyl-ACP methyl ester carboxylesterase